MQKMNVTSRSRCLSPSWSPRTFTSPFYISVVSDRWLQAETRLPISFKHLNMTLKFWMFLLYLLIVWDGLHISTVIHGQCEVEDIRNEVLCWDYRRPISLNEHMHCISEGIHIPALLRCCWFHSSASLAVALTRVSSFKSMRSDCAKYSRSIRSIWQMLSEPISGR